MKKIAVVGIQGLPAQYGGFETLAENLVGNKQSNDIEYTVFCSSKDLSHRRKKYKNANLRYVPLKANGIQSIFYDIVSLLLCVGRYDVVLICGVSGCAFLPFFKLLSKSKIIVNIDGAESNRKKWGRVAKTFLKFSEKMAVKYANIVISDNKGIEDYIMRTYSKKSIMIAYGGDHVLCNLSFETQKSILDRYGLQKGSYALSICRIEPENNVHVLLQALADYNKKYVFVGNWNQNEYSRYLFEKYKDISNILLLDAIYDKDILFVLRNNAFCYLHGHSVGGTNPSLVEAMFFNVPIIAYDVNYNKHTTHDKANYFSTSDDLRFKLDSVNKDFISLRDIAFSEYSWQSIVDQYEKLYI